MKLGFVGCGKMARAHAAAAQKLGHSIAGAAAATPASSAAFCASFGGAAASDWRAFTKTCDALVVATPWNVTESLLPDLLRSGRPCLIEKPAALSSSALSSAMAGAGADASVRVLIGYNRRFYEVLEPVREALTSEELLAVEMHLPEAAAHFRVSVDEAVLAHVLCYMSSHWYDLLTHLVGPVSVGRMYARRRKGDGFNSTYNGLLWADRFNAPVHVVSHFDAPANTALTFHFASRIYRLSPIEKLTVYEGLKKVTSPNGQNRYTPVISREMEEPADFKPGFVRQMKNFIDTCVLKSVPNQIGCTLSEALALTRFLEEVESESVSY